MQTFNVTVKMKNHQHPVEIGELSHAFAMELISGLNYRNVESVTIAKED
jgi:hypothetical protein